MRRVLSMNTSNIIIALFVYGFSEKSENKYSNISIALLFSSPTKNEPRSHAALTLAQYFY